MSSGAPIGGLVDSSMPIWICAEIRPVYGRVMGDLSPLQPADICGLTLLFFSHSKFGGTRESNKL